MSTDVKWTIWAAVFIAAVSLFGACRGGPAPAPSRSIECTGAGEWCMLDDAHNTCVCVNEPDSRQWK